MKLHSIIVPLLASCLAAQTPQTSGRALTPEQAAYDVKYYGLELLVHPEKKTIEGTLTMRAVCLEAVDAIVLDLDDHLEVRAVRSGDTELAFTHEQHRIRITHPNLFRAVSGKFEVAVDYGGKPRVAPRPPWEGGFTWAQTADGRPWIATSCQSDGADLWWPCKDQPDDEPDAMDLRIRVPEGLVVASNGRLRDVETKDGWSTYHWHVSTPINAYGVALNIAPYETIETEYESVTGERFPVTYWVLPENLEPGKLLFQDILRQVRFFEETFGPYPFRRDKYGVAETPHLGMEHQSIIAYGNEYRGNPWGEDRGFDFLHHHEMAHEWWANLVTCRNWNDFWIHEGFATYAQSLYCEELNGIESYHAEMRSNRPRLRNERPVAPREPKSTREMYFSSQGSDIYYKGAWILHTLRYLVGDEDFFLALRRMAYPQPELELKNDGSVCRFTTTEEIREIAESVSGEKLDWFFEVYLRRGPLPRLEIEREGGELRLRWHAPDGLPFPMPVDVRVDGETRRVDCPGGEARIAIGEASEVEVDPEQWILKE